MFKVKFWGVRGSVPAPLTTEALRARIKGYVNKDGVLDVEGLDEVFTYGGNTSCVEVICGADRIILDMGTGLRPLGNSLFPEMLRNKGLIATILLSHVHWDHIQGLPFFGPLYVNKETGVKNCWKFYGGTNWQKTAETVLRGQMDPPTFPVSWSEIADLTHSIQMHSLHDRMSFQVQVPPLSVGPKIYTRKLNHPQETYGWRIEYNGRVLAYTTDNEPFDPLQPDPRLLDLVHDADMWITDCQYTKEMYEGKDGPPRHGWGHSYPEAVAMTVKKGNVKNVYLFHHDPSSSDEKIDGITQTCRMAAVTSMCKVVGAYEGLEVVLDEFD